MRVEVLYCEPFEWAEDITKRMTGRWKTKVVNGVVSVYVEVKGVITTSWLDADYINVLQIEETINECVD